MSDRIPPNVEGGEDARGENFWYMRDQARGARYKDISDHWTKEAARPENVVSQMGKDVRSRMRHQADYAKQTGKRNKRKSTKR